jgi:hypothetical protein
LLFIVRVFDPVLVAHDQDRTGNGRLFSARLSSIALRHGRWGGLTEAEKPPQRQS